MDSQPEVSLGVAFTDVYESSHFWPILALITALLALDSLLPSNGSWLVVGVSVSVFLGGYQVSFSRVIFEGGTALPAPFGEIGLNVRRGVSALAVVSVPVFVGLFLFFIATSVLRAIGSRMTGAIWLGAAALSLVVLLVPVFVSATARYVAFDKVREGFRYRRALGQLRAHIHPGGQVVGYSLAGALVLTVTRYAVLSPLGLSSAGQRAAALAGIRHGLLGQGLALIGIEFALAAVSALWQLLTAGLLGQFTAIAYDSERVPGSV